MSTTKVDIASDIITNLTPTEMAWVMVEVGNDYIDNQTLALQQEVVELMAVEGFDPTPFCRKKKSPKPH